MLKKIIPSEAIIFITAMWTIFILNGLLIGVELNNFGIRPREINGLIGIILSPFLHGSLYHIISNTIPFFVLCILLRWTYGSVKLMAVIIIGALVGGFGTWLFSTGGVVVGASGVVFALIGFSFTNAFFNPSLKNWVCTIAAFSLYGGTLLSLLTVVPKISWAAHFWGFMAGILAAKLLREDRSNSPNETAS